MFITWLTCFMFKSFPGMLPNRSFFATHKLLFVVVFFCKCTLPQVAKFVSNLFTNFLRSNIKALILKILDTWARKGFGVQRHSACQLPSFKPHMDKKNTSRYTATLLSWDSVLSHSFYQEWSCCECSLELRMSSASERHSQHCHYVAVC